MWMNYGFLLLITIGVHEVAAKFYPLYTKYDQNIVKGKYLRQKRQFGFGQNPGFQFNQPQGNDYPNDDSAVFFDEENTFGDFVRPNRPRGNQNSGFRYPSFFDDDDPASNYPSFNGPTTQNPRAVTSVNIPGMGTTQSACEDRCLTTPQYNPVCGDNNVTYLNIEKFKCAVRCGRNVKIAAYRACPRIMVK